MTPNLHISLLCYNRLDLTKRCLASILAHTPKPYTLHITDNGSNDGTVEWLNSIPTAPCQLHLNSTNLGYKDPHNAVFALANQQGATHLAILNNDMDLGYNWWPTALAAFQANPRLALVGNSLGSCSRLEPTFHGRPAAAHEPPEYVEGSMLIVNVGLVAPLAPTLFSPHLQFIYGEDSDLSLRVREQGLDIAVLNLNSRHQGSATIHSLDQATRNKINACQVANHRYLRHRWRVYLKRRSFDYRVLIQRRHALGDVIDVTPLLPLIKQKWPLCRIEVQTDFPEVFAGNPRVERAAPRITTPPDYLCDLNLAYERRPHEHTMPAYAQVCDVPCDLTTLRPILYHSASDSARAQSLCHGRYALLHPGPTNWRGKDWPLERWAILARKLKAMGYRTVCIGQGHPITGADVDLRSQTSIPVLHALMERASLFVGLDSGPSHVAQATDTPSVVLFGTVLAERKLFPAARVLGVQADQRTVPCVGEHHRLPAPVEHSQCDGACMRAITVEMVEAAVERITQ